MTLTRNEDWNYILVLKFLERNYMEGDYKEVYFDQYCIKCKYINDDENDPESPCWDCLENPTNQDSHKPVNFKPADE